MSDEVCLTRKEIKVLMTLLGGPAIPILDQLKTSGLKVNVVEISDLFLKLGDAYDALTDKNSKTD